ncbi:MAG TPA: cysteine hydrolase family protein [Cellulomonas sp.]
MSTPVRPGGTALVLIDLQVDVLAPCGDVPGVLERTARLLARARSSGVPVVHVQHSEEGLDPGTPGWQIAAPVRPVDGEPVVHKRYRDAFAGTDLTEVLAAAGADRLVVAGAQSDCCVRATLHRAAVEGYDLTPVADCHTTTGQDAAGVHLTAEQVVAHCTADIAGLRYPGRTIGVAPHDTVPLDA